MLPERAEINTNTFMIDEAQVQALRDSYNSTLQYVATLTSKTEATPQERQFNHDIQPHQNLFEHALALAIFETDETREMIHEFLLHNTDFAERADFVMNFVSYLMYDQNTSCSLASLRDVTKDTLRVMY